MKKYTQSDLENAIHVVWQTADDLKLFFEHHGDAPKPMTEDEVSNMLLGIYNLHEMRCKKLHDMMCRVFELDQYCTDPKKLAAREELFGTKKGKKK
jgi:hypothetical protein